jgi:hypothetical protein
LKLMMALDIVTFKGPFNGYVDGANKMKLSNLTQILMMHFLSSLYFCHQFKKLVTPSYLCMTLKETPGLPFPS